MSLRNKNFIKQIKASFIYRILAMLISFVLVRYMLEYLGTELYGVWSVILSFMTWILFFDLGIANGVKNKVSESLARDEESEAQEFISTGYIILTVFSVAVYILFYIVSYFLDWQSIFNIYSISNDLLLKVLRITLFFILLNFVLSIIIAVFNAVQKASLVVLNQFLSNLLSLIMILLLLKYTTTNLLYLASAYGFILVLSNIILSVWFYKKNTMLSPKVHLFNRTKVKDISKLGMSFFFLQLTIFFMLTTDRFIITQLLGPSMVTTYDILYKYFGAILIIHGIVNSPLWPMYTEAYVKNDYKWISDTLVKMVKLCLIYIIILTVMIMFANVIFPLWLGDNTPEMSMSNYIYMAITLLFLAWHNIFAYFTNGIEQTKIQLYSTLFGAIINIPLSILFVKYFDMGLNGVLLATIISLSIFGFFGPIQAIKEIKLMKLQTSRNELR